MNQVGNGVYPARSDITRNSRQHDRAPPSRKYPPPSRNGVQGHSEGQPRGQKILAMAADMEYPGHMDTLNPDTGGMQPSESEAARTRRIAWEADRIAEARADVAAGRMIDAAAVDAWID
jgi:hypothetical protein